MERLINAVRADPALRDQFERATLSDKLLHLPDQVADLVSIVTSFAEAADTQFAAVNRRLTTIESDVGTLKSERSAVLAAAESESVWVVVDHAAHEAA